jgi:hypothetical protein
MGPQSPTIYGAVEGIVDEAVLRCLITQLGAVPGPIYGKAGKNHLVKKLRAYNHAASIERWVVLMDLDHDADCAPPFCTICLPNPAYYMSLRIAVREIETWLLADRERIARFLGIAITRIPHNLEEINDPKQLVVQLAAHSRKRDIRQDMTPRPNSTRHVGPAYTSRLIEFIQDATDGWRPVVAAELSDSLNRCLRAMQRLIDLRNSPTNGLS